MQIAFFFDQTRCVGCYTCCVACKDWHDIPAGSVHWRRVLCLEEGRYPEPFVAFLSYACNHCGKPPCVDACPSSAIHKREKDGIVVVDREACLGELVCEGACREACPYEAPQFGDEDGHKMQKCDLCLERWEQGKKPICVDACPTRALDAGPIERLTKLYGSTREGIGFDWSPQVKPSLLMKPKAKDF